MSKTVTIPSYKNPYDVDVNGRKYAYRAGDTLEVPDEVAEVIEHDLDLIIEPLPVPKPGGGSGGDEWFNDGNTHIWITMPEGATSPMLGVCPNGTVTVDWGDGTAPDMLTGTSTSTIKWTPKHEYAGGGEYIITLTASGSMGLLGKSTANAGPYILRHSSSVADNRNYAYRAMIKKVEIGDGVTVGTYSFYDCHELTSVRMPDSVSKIDDYAFNLCNSLTTVIMPSNLNTIGKDGFSGCKALPSISIPDGVASIASRAFYNCYSVASISIPDSVTSIGASAFGNCYYVSVYDFTKHTSVPELGGTNAFAYIASDCEIRVPAALYDEWIAATNWTEYASNIVAV